MHGKIKSELPLKELVPVDRNKSVSESLTIAQISDLILSLINCVILVKQTDLNTHELCEQL